MFPYLKGLHPVQPFHHPSEILPDRVDAEETQKPTVSPPDKGGYKNLSCEQAKECAVPNETPSSNQHNSISFSKESIEPLSSDNCLSNPYRTQSPVENRSPRTAKQFRLVPVKQRDRTMSHTVYVTLDMFEQGQSSWNQDSPARSFQEFLEVVLHARANKWWNCGWLRLPWQCLVVSNSNKVICTTEV